MPFHSPSIHFLDLYEVDGWRLKVYGIREGRNRPATQLVNAAKGVARRHLPSPAVHAGCYGVGSLIVREHAYGNWVLLDWWVRENEREHHVYFSPANDRERLEYMSSTDAVTCHYEHSILGFEQHAWINTVLANPTGPDIDAYLARRISATFTVF